MLIEQFRAVCAAMFGPQWKGPLCRKLNITRSTLRNWTEDGETPGWVDAELGLPAHPDWPRSEWVFGEGMGREYVVHLMPPRFHARLVRCDDDGLPLSEEEPADVLSGATYAIDDHAALCEVVWIDDPPKGKTTELLRAAAAFIAGHGGAGE